MTIASDDDGEEAPEDGEAADLAQDEQQDIDTAEAEFEAAVSEKTELIPRLGEGDAPLDIPTGTMPAVSEDSGADEAPESDDDMESAFGELAEDGEGTFLTEADELDGEGGGYTEFTEEAGLSGYIDPEVTNPNMPSPEDTQFFDVTEAAINEGAKEDRKKARKRRGAGLKVAIVIVVLCILVAAAAAAAYVMGYGYPLQEDVTRDFFAAVQNDQSTDQYWADDVEAGARSAQLASVEGLNSYNVEAVQRSMTQTAVYVKGTLEEGGQVDYEVVLSRDGLSWAIEYVELYFPSKN